MESSFGAAVNVLVHFKPVQPPPFWVQSCFIRLLAAEKELTGRVFKKQKPKGPNTKNMGFPPFKGGWDFSRQRKEQRERQSSQRAGWKPPHLVKGRGDSLVRLSTVHMCRRAQEIRVVGHIWGHIVLSRGHSDISFTISGFLASLLISKVNGLSDK